MNVIRKEITILAEITNIVLLNIAFINSIVIKLI